MINAIPNLVKERAVCRWSMERAMVVPKCTVQSMFTQALGDKDEFALEDAQKSAAAVRVTLASIATQDPAYAARVQQLLGLWDQYVKVSVEAVKGQIGGSSDMQALQQMAKDKIPNIRLNVAKTIYSIRQRIQSG